MPATETTTFLFTDIEQSGPMSSALGVHPHTELLATYGAICRDTLARFGGEELAITGGGLCAAFDSPSACLAAATAIQRALHGQAWPTGELVRTRIGIHSGDATAATPALDVRRAGQIAAIGHGGQILVSAATAAIVREDGELGASFRYLGTHRLKDLGRPERVFQFEAEGPQDFPPLRSLDNPDLRHNLPSQTSTFVGRRAEMRELQALIAGGSRLITLVGPGGIGKSRLALQVAAATLDGSGEGVWLVELSPVVDPELVATTLAAVLQIQEEPGRPILDTMIDAVGARHLLLVLDNAERVLDTTAKLADTLLRSCPRVVLLVTSREVLGVGGEQLYRVPPLSIPTGEILTSERLASFESVQLFVERAALQRRDFSIDDNNWRPVASVCARLDGIPLALELAAARLRSLSVSEIEARLDERFRLLTGADRFALPHHRTLRALIDWSYELLSADEQDLLDRLSVFSGGWTIDAAEAVARGDATDAWQVLDLLASLVEKSLVQAEETEGITRYTLLETVRHYAAERLALRGISDLRSTRAAHRDHYLTLVETAASHLHGGEQARWLDRLEADIDNIRLALSFCIADVDGAEPGLRLATALRWFCPKRGHGREVLDALDSLLARPDARGPTLTRARALNASCALLDRFGDYKPSASSAEEAIGLGRDLNDDTVIADGLCQLSWINYEQDDLPTALAQSNEAIEVARTADDPHLLAEILTCRAVLETARQDWDAALCALEEVLALSRTAKENFGLASTLANVGAVKLALGDSHGARTRLDEARILAGNLGYQNLLAAVLENLGLAEILDGDIHQAKDHFINSLQTAQRAGVKSCTPSALLGLALVASAIGEPTVAATLHGAADQHYERAGRPFEVLEGKLRESDRAHLRATLGPTMFDDSHQRGRLLDQTEAVDLATALAGPSGGPSPEPSGSRATDGSPSALSTREREIVALLAGGATDAQIAEALFLSVNTVRSHLERIRDKTGARRRTELARYVLEAGIEAVPPSA